MIAKHIKGKGARGLADYLTADKDNKGEVRPVVVDLGGTLPGATPREMARAMGALHALRPTVSRYVAHAMLRWDVASGDAPDYATQADMMTSHMRALGFEDFRIISHGTEVHAMASRIRPDGSVVDERNDWRLAEQSVRALEIRHGLRRLESSPNGAASPPRSDYEGEPKPRSITRGEMGLAHRAVRDAARQGREVDPADMPKKPQLADAVLAAREAALLDGATVGAFVRACRRAGVETRPNWSPDTGRVSGLSFFMTDAPEVEISASKLSRGLSWSNLLKGGISYEHGRDGAELRTASERAESLRPRAETGRAALPGDPNLGRPGGGIPSLGRDAGGPHEGRGPRTIADGGHAGPDAGSLEQDGVRDGASAPATPGRRDAEHGGASRPPAGGGRGDGARDEHGAPPAGRGGDARRADGEGPDGGASGRGRPVAEAGAGDPRHGDGGDRGGQAQVSGAGHHGDFHGPHHERLVSLGGVEDDRFAATLTAVRQTVRALGAPSYVVGILPPKGSTAADIERQGLHTMHRTYSADQLAGGEVVKYLRAMNARGQDIYLKPHGGDEAGKHPPLVLVDDLTADAVDRMRADGLAPALVVMTSARNNQAWLRLGSDPLPVEVLGEVARDLAQRYGGDLFAAKSVQMGRLPGFTNRKPERIAQNGGRPPFARVVEAIGHVAARAGELVRGAVSRVTAQAVEQALRWERVQALHARRAQEREGEDAVASVARHMRASGARSAPGHGLSEIDFAGACGALRDGHAPEAVIAALRHLSPDVETRHARADDYVARTVAKAQAEVGRTWRPDPPS